MSSKSRLPAIGMALAVFSFLGADAALAQADAHPAAGVLKLKNIRVEQATAAQIANAPRVATPSGMRAYIDPATGELREQTPEEALEAGMSLKSRVAASFKSAVAGPLGGLFIVADETLDLNTIVVRDASGKQRMLCVPGAQVNSVLGRVIAAKEHGHAH